MRTISTRPFLAAALALLMPVSASAAEPLYTLINERLSLMQAVAAHKWHAEQPIEAAEREQIVIERAVMDGLRYGITSASSERFFRAQIEAAKDIQRCWFTRWSSQGTPDPAPDLDREIRPELLELGTEITGALTSNNGDHEGFRKAVSVGCLSADHRDSIFDALEAIDTYPDRFTQIMQSGVLRVGTTGDYAPFSFARDNEPFRGIDIDLAVSLAEFLGVRAIFVKTSWPTLMADLQADH